MRLKIDQRVLVLTIPGYTSIYANNQIIKGIGELQNWLRYASKKDLYVSPNVENILSALSVSSVQRFLGLDLGRCQADLVVDGWIIKHSS